MPMSARVAISMSGLDAQAARAEARSRRHHGGDRAVRHPLPDTPPQNWRHGLERAARRDWELYHRHPWILAKVLVTTRAHFSPALAADSESAFSSFDGLGLEPADAFRYMLMFASYVQGVALTYVSDVEAERLSANAARRGVASPEAVRAPLFAPGAYPRLGPAMRAGGDPWDLDALFLAGLSGVLDGIEADLTRRRPHGSAGLGLAARRMYGRTDARMPTSSARGHPCIHVRVLRSRVSHAWGVGVVRRAACAVSARGLRRGRRPAGRRRR
ncbi:TetR/AcrR family transcriptional regulator C-terminal domain-containing protein [Streptomyces sp. NPDC056169]|uniref:TetR/AcrR family transcriptional regulator C-terminal domain-containing protein n=1 Tax=Streptomyces sp. NPDC056169 TaxID=3345734 RepID=UPI0035E03A23